MAIPGVGGDGGVCILHAAAGKYAVAHGRQLRDDGQVQPQALRLQEGGRKTLALSVNKLRTAPHEAGYTVRLRRWQQWLTGIHGSACFSGCTDGLSRVAHAATHLGADNAARLERSLHGPEEWLHRKRKPILPSTSTPEAAGSCW